MAIFTLKELEVIIIPPLHYWLRRDPCDVSNVKDGENLQSWFYVKIQLKLMWDFSSLNRTNQVIPMHPCTLNVSCFCFDAFMFYSLALRKHYSFKCDLISTFSKFSYEAICRSAENFDIFKMCWVQMCTGSLFENNPSKLILNSLRLVSGKLWRTAILDDGSIVKMALNSSPQQELLKLHYPAGLLSHLPFLKNLDILWASRSKGMASGFPE